MSRGRLWLLAFAQRLLDEAGVVEDDLKEYAYKVLEPLVTDKLRDLDDFLLPESHTAVKKEIARSIQLEAKRSRGSRRTKGKKRTIAWHELHAKACDRRGVDWWTSRHPGDDVIEQHPGLKRLSERMLDYAWLRGLRFPEARKACVELSQSQRDSAKILSFREGESEIITPTGMPAALHRNRLVTGREALLLQGIHYGSCQHKLSEFNDDLLRNLAGNTFNAFCNAAVRIVRTACLAHLDTRARARAGRKGHGPRRLPTFGLFDFD